MKDNKIKKAVIREDLFAITGDFRKAIILNQFIYWSERVSDADKFIEKENEIAKSNGKEERDLFYGWIYKTAEELSEEVMLGLSASQIRRYINDLVDLKYISKRTNPNYKWDRTLQYRVNLVNIAKSLKEKGYPLSDYKIEIPDNDLSNTHQCVIKSEPEENQSQSNEQAIPENTNKDYNGIDYISETTDINALENVKKSFSKGDMYAPVSGKQEGAPEKQNRYISPDYTEEQLREHIKPVVYSEVEQYVNDWGTAFSKDDANEFIDIVCAFNGKYKERYGENHYVMPDKTIRSVVRRYLQPPEEMDGVFESEKYEKLMDKYFSTNFNKQGKYDGEITLSFPHFMSDTIRGHLANRCWN